MNFDNTKEIKLSYINDVKEELGLVKKERKKKLKVPPHLKPYIKKAIKQNPDASNREIRELTLELLSKEPLPFFGILEESSSQDLLRIINDKELFYE